MSQNPAVPLTPTRKRGAQPGNLNAIKHGFYSSRYRSLDQDCLEDTSSFGLQNEVNMLRVYILRVLEIFDSSPDAYNPIHLLHGLSFAANAIARLVKFQAYLREGEPDELEQALTLALAQVRQEFGLDRDGDNESDSENDIVVDLLGNE